MALVSASVSQASNSGLALEDYSIYNQLSDDELLALAIERSLTNSPSLSGNQNQPGNQSSASRGETSGGLSTRRTGQPNGPNSANPPPNQPPEGAAAQYSSHNPPVDKLFNPKNFSGTVSHFITGQGKRMVAYRKHDGALVHVCPEPEEEDGPLFAAIKKGDVRQVRALVGQEHSQMSSKPGWMAIHEAACYGQEACLNVLLTGKGQGMINMRTAQDQTALLLAVSYSHAACARLLLERGADTALMNKDRETPLYKACEEDNAEIVAMLLNHGASVNVHCNQGWTPLQEAVCRNNVEICEMLVQAGARLTPANVYGISPLFTAAQSGQVATLRFLIKHGADVDSQATDGATALYEATKNGHVKVVELLLSQKADANKASKRGLLPLHIAAQNGDDILVPMLIPATTKARIRRAGISPLHVAAEHNMDDVLELLIQADFDVNAQLSHEHSKLYEDHRTTALYFSVANNNVDAVRMLLEAGADPNLDLFNPLLVAVRGGCMETVTLLVEHGADVNAYLSTHPTTFPATVLFAMKYLSMLKYILDNGCDALACFRCAHGSSPHPPLKLNHFERDEMRYTEINMTECTARHCVQFCEMVSIPSMCRWAGPIIDVLLDYVGRVKLCSRLQEHLDSYPDWHPIKVRATTTPPLMQMCRLRIRQVVGVQRLRRLKTLPLPGSLLRFLVYKGASIDFE
ncbi:ankyrin repeat and SOCS box protein 2 isoform X1 [Gadus macrocephalus]|uniref:ankyrin repeat and SOCS box protein 2 isoform X1 n=2 Tax=Gadus macrocephalus TaxID=80720 RepID=UPI0028CB8CCB|nr:ankyrin repeat and SOCS box protein 2 isoform X1 [Gadus macrocephalus]XP_059897248.1 ankyrin repeat and SOCS box protein 2 isoform X1 [Gadus macrocephalus]